MVANKAQLIAIVGPTASGKTTLAISIAKALNGEIIAVDSRTVYKELSIGTAKPTKQQQKEARHWGLDLVSPDQTYTASNFKTYANKAILDIESRGKLPIMVGGTGLYMDGVLYDFSFAKPNHTLRAVLAYKSVDELQTIIVEKDITMPTNKLNKLHLITAIERQNKPLERKPLRKNTLLIGISPDRTVLRKTVTERAEQMIKDGVLNEIAHVSNKYGWDAPGLRGGIYTYMRPYIEGVAKKDDCLNNYITSDMQLAKRQMTWLKRNNDIVWFSDVKKAEAWILNLQRSTL